MDYTREIRDQAATAGLTEAQTDAIINRCGHDVMGGGKIIGNRACEAAAQRAIATAVQAAKPVTVPEATDRQYSYLRSLGADVTGTLTRREASALIDQCKTSRTAGQRAYATGRRYGIDGQVWDD